MNKFTRVLSLVLVLVLVMALSLVACGGTTEPAARTEEAKGLDEAGLVSIVTFDDIGRLHF